MSLEQSPVDYYIKRSEAYDVIAQRLRASGTCARPRLLAKNIGGIGYDIIVVTGGSEVLHIMQLPKNSQNRAMLEYIPMPDGKVRTMSSGIESSMVKTVERTELAPEIRELLENKK